MAYYNSYNETVDSEKDSNKPYQIPNKPMDIPLLLAEKQARKIWGHGVMIDSDDKEILTYLQEFTRINRIHEQIIAFEEIKSQKGQSVTYLEPILEGENVPRWGYADPNMMQSVHKMYITETSGTIYKYITKDMKTWPVVETWTPKTMKRAYYRPLGEMDTGWNVFYNLEALKTREIKTTEEIPHNLGCMPLNEHRNKQAYVHPYIDVWNWKYTLATWYPVDGMIKNYYELIRQIMKKMILSKPKIIGELQPDAMGEVVEGDWGPYQHDFIYNLRTKNGGDGRPLGAEIVQGNTDLTKDFQAAQDMLRLIFLQVGLSDPFSSEQTYQSVSEIQSKNSSNEGWGTKMTELQEETKVVIQTTTEILKEDIFKLYIIKKPSFTEVDWFVTPDKPLERLNDRNHVQFLYLDSSENFYSPYSVNFLYSELTFKSLNNRLSDSGYSVINYVQLSYPGIGFAWPMLEIDDTKDKDLPLHQRIKVGLDKLRTIDVGVWGAQLKIDNTAIIHSVRLMGYPVLWDPLGDREDEDGNKYKYDYPRTIMADIQKRPNLPPPPIGKPKDEPSHIGIYWLAMTVTKDNYINFPNYVPWYYIIDGGIYDNGQVRWFIEEYRGGKYEKYHFWSRMPVGAPINPIKPNDITFQLGAGVTSFIGNTHFLSEERRLTIRDYNSSTSIEIPYQVYLKNIYSN